MIAVTIDGKELELAEKTSILKAARMLGIRIPTLCHNDQLSAAGSCRVCLVEVAAKATPERTRLLPSCCVPVEEGMLVVTDSPRVQESRKFVLELMLARCPDSEELKEIARGLGVPVDRPEALDIVGGYLLSLPRSDEQTKCIRCGQCVRACAEVPKRHAISFSGRGLKRRVVSPFGTVAETCIGCGSCAYVCPTKTITVEPAT